MRRWLASAKHSAEGESVSRVRETLSLLSKKQAFRPRDIDAVMIGTIQFMTALLEARGLSRTAVVRLGLPATSLLPPFAGWPPHMAAAVHGGSFLTHGGHEFDGRRIARVVPEELRRIAGRHRRE